MNPVMRFLVGAAMCAGFALAAGGGMARADAALFSPVVKVNDRAVTKFELVQRALFLKLLRTPGDLEAQARQALIEDRLREDAGRAFKVKLTDEQVAEGMAEFAGRAQLSTEDFLKALAAAGVEPQTFRDFVAAGLIWREVVRTKFGPRAAVSEAEVDRALSVAGQPGSVRVLLSELVIPAPPEKAAEAEAFARELAGTLRGEAAFAEAVRQYSASPTRDRGGVIDWLPLANLPPAIGAEVLKKAPGSIIGPVVIPNAVAIFLLRGVEASRDLAPAAVTVDYARFLIPDGQSPTAQAQAADLQAKAKGCGDLYGAGLGLPPERLLRDVQTMAAVPADIGLDLARLDPAETSVSLDRSGALVVLMLCSRTVTPAEPVADPAAAAAEPAPGSGPPDAAVDSKAAAEAARNATRARLINTKLNGLSEAYMADLVANARIVTP